MALLRTKGTHAGAVFTMYGNTVCLSLLDLSAASRLELKALDSLCNSQETVKNADLKRG
jgi:hypothetical protein